MVPKLVKYLNKRKEGLEKRKISLGWEGDMSKWNQSGEQSNIFGERKIQGQKIPDLNAEIIEKLQDKSAEKQSSWVHAHRVLK